MTQILVYFKILNDSVSYCIYETNDGTCNINYLATQKNQQEFKSKIISEVCDQDQSIPGCSWSTFSIEQGNAFLSVEYWIYIPDLLLNDDGMMDAALSFEDYEYMTDTSFTRFQVRENGQIEAAKIVA